MLQVYNVGQLLALAWGIAIAGALILRFIPRKGLQLLGVFVISLLLGALALPDSFAIFADRHAAQLSPRITVLVFVLFTCCSLPAAAWLGRWCARPILRWVAFGLALLASLPNNFVLDANYLGLHLYLCFNSVVLGYAALHGVRAPDPRWSWLERAARALRLERSQMLLAIPPAVLALIGLLGPGSAVTQQLASIEGAPLARSVAWVREIARGAAPIEAVRASLPPEQRQWYVPRDKLASIPPSPRPSLLPGEHPIVLFFTFDSVRADLFQSEAWMKKRRFFPKFDKDAFAFRMARSAGSATAPSLTAMFSGKHYSEVAWNTLKGGQLVWPNRDPTLRFPALLNKHGVHTVTITARSWFLSKWRVTAGFVEEHDLDAGKMPRNKYPSTHKILDTVKEVLTAGIDAPLFLYAHFMDTHTPYDSGTLRGGTPKARYISEVEKVDQELAGFQRWLEKEGFDSKVTLIISADHGEAFGEHGTLYHSKSLYDELIHVPLWMRIPGQEGRPIETPVSLIDMGPTLLDLFGAPTPGYAKGQSLVRLMRGEDPGLTRPIAAETRLRQTIVFPDGIKAIKDQLSGAREVYDLNNDPLELRNIIDDVDRKYQDRLDVFFRVHRHPMYTDHAPYRP